MLAGPEEPVDVVRAPGVRWHAAAGSGVRSAETAGEVVTDGRLGWTDRTRTPVDPIGRGPLDDAVVALDRLVQHRATFLEDVVAAVAKLPRCRGSRQAREVVSLADGLAESPQETGSGC